MSEIKYRTETYSGSGVRAASIVIACEVFQLNNPDILEYLLDNNLVTGDVADTCRQYIDELEREYFINDMSFKDGVDFVKSKLLPAIKQTTGVDVKYALWLADKDVACGKAIYGAFMSDADAEVDAYEVGPVTLSNLGREGLLYGYPELPQPIKT